MSDQAVDWDELADEARSMEQTLPTEAMVGPVTMAIRRGWSPGGRPMTGFWYAALDFGPFRNVWECDHHHDTETGAWSCCKTALTIIVTENGNPDHYSWEVDG